MIAGMRVVKHVINPIRPQLAITYVPTITNPVVPIKPVARVAPVARVEPVAGPDAFDRQLNRIEGSGRLGAAARARAIIMDETDNSPPINLNFAPTVASSPIRARSWSPVPRQIFDLSGASELLGSYDDEDDFMVDANVLDQFAAVAVTEPVTVTEPIADPEPENNPEDEDL
jgi:hypothetical protein